MATILPDDNFKCIFLYENNRILIRISLKFVPRNCQYVSNGSDYGLAPSRRQAIIWTNAYPIQQRIYAALGGDGLSGLEWKHEVLFWQHIYDIS